MEPTGLGAAAAAGGPVCGTLVPDPSKGGTSRACVLPVDGAKPPSLLSDSTPVRRAWVAGPEPAAQVGSWRALSDDDLLQWLEECPNHSDEELLEIVASERHFYVRQMAALELKDPEALKRFADDRHVGQILARRLARDEDADYLQELVRHSRHLEVRSAAQAQLRALEQHLRSGSVPRPSAPVMLFSVPSVPSAPTCDPSLG